MMKKIYAVLSILLVMGAACSCSVGEFINEKLNGVQNMAQEYSVSVGMLKGNGQVFFNKETIRHGSSLTITVKPEYGNEVNIIKINGVDYTKNLDNNLLVLDKVTSNVIIDVEFKGLSGYAAYVAPNNAPVIDGEIDSVWDVSYDFYVRNKHSDNSEELYEDISCVNVLWNESGLYYLCYVKDSDLVYGDVCNLWVSEVYSSEAHLRDPETNEWYIANYSTNPEDGTYAISAAADGNNYVYTGIDVTDYWTCSAKITDFGYILEIFMPRLGETPLKAGATMGFDISIDYYSTGGNGRDYYANWNGHAISHGGGSCPVLGWLNNSHGYWTCPAALKEIVLLPEKE